MTQYQALRGRLDFSGKCKLYAVMGNGRDNLRGVELTRFPAIRRAIIADKNAQTSIAIAAGLIGAATLFRWLTWPVIPHLVFVGYFPAVLIISMLLGWRWGLPATILSGVIGAYFLPETTQPLTSPRALAGLLAFYFSALIVVATADTLRRTVRNLEVAKRSADYLNEELQHRVGNTLAVVQAIASQTLRHTGAKEFPAAFGGRLRALGRANRLMGLSSENRCNLRELVSEACAPFFDGNNLILHGPGILLPPESCVPLTLCLHELCTNATKHGALSAPGGRVSISWMPDRSGILTIAWQELGGPPVRPPSRAGMGTRLLTRQEGIKGVELRYLPLGLECDILIEGAVSQSANLARTRP